MYNINVLDCSVLKHQAHYTVTTEMTLEISLPGKDNLERKTIVNRLLKHACSSTAKTFGWTKYLHKPSNLSIAEIFSKINFRPCGKGHHRLYGQKLPGIKILPMRGGGEKGKNFLEAKIYGYKYGT